MVARLITPPVAEPVTLTEVKDLIRVTDEAEDTVVQAFIGAAVGMLDGRTGLLGRAIMPQTWAEDLDMPGPWVLALPDIDTDSVVVTVDDVAVDSGAISVAQSAQGPVLTLTGISGSQAVVTYSAALPAARLRTAKVLIGLMVDAWYDKRSASGDLSGMSPAALAMLDQLSWKGI